MPDEIESVNYNFTAGVEAEKKGLEKPWGAPLVVTEPLLSTKTPKAGKSPLEKKPASSPLALMPLIPALLMPTRPIVVMLYISLVASPLLDQRPGRRVR